MYRFRKHRGDAMISSIVAAAVTGVLCFGIAKTVGTTMQSQTKVVGSVHATTYADTRINVLKNTPYDQLANLPKTKIEIVGDGNATYYESVELKEETTTEPIGRWAYISIYEGESETPVDTFRYFLLKDGMSGVPKGSIMLWSGLNVPNGWHICDGSTVNGVKLPDMRNRFIVGAGDEYSLNAYGGSDTVALNVNQIPAHTHSASIGEAGAHSHTYNDMVPEIPWDGDYGIGGGGGHHREDRTRWTSTAPNHTHSIFIGNTGGNQAHENRPRYLAVYYIIKL